MTYRLLFTFFFFTLVLSASAQQYTLTGQVNDAQGEALPNVTILVIGEKNGTYSNSEGKFELSLAKGSHQVQFQSMGYALNIIPVEMKGDQQLNIVLQEQAITLSGVNINSDAEDPAYYIMRKAIGLAKFYRQQVMSYDMRAYVKGGATVKKIPGMFKMMMDDEDEKKLLDKPLVMESVVDVHYRQPQEYQQKVISYRSSIPDADDQVDPMQFVTTSLYDEKTDIMISPLSRNAFQFYRFKYEGTFEDRGMQVNKIKLSPKRKGQQYYRGYIYIVENAWFIHSTNLVVPTSFGDVHVKQLYAPQNDGVWMPVSLKVDGDISVMGVELVFDYMTSLSNYTVVPDTEIQAQIAHALPKEVAETLVDSPEDTIGTINERTRNIQQLMAKDDLSNKEMRKLQRLVKKEAKKNAPEPPLEIRSQVKVDSLARQRSGDYWNTVRPVPLTIKEQESFTEKDSIVAVTSSPAYKDSVKQAEMKFHAGDVIFGNTYKYPDHRAILRYTGLLDSLQFNTVDGFKLTSGMTFSKETREHEQWELGIAGGYTFARKAPLLKMKFEHHYAPRHFGSYSVEGGKWTSDYNPSTGMHVLENIVSSLFLGDNYLKLYEKNFLHLTHQYEPVNGLMVDVGYRFEDRHVLDNFSSTVFWRGRDERYTANIPVVEDGGADLNFDHQVNIVSVGLKYTPRHRYYFTKKGVKKHVKSKYPTIGAHYRKGFSDKINYDFADLSIEQQFEVGFLGSLTYMVKGSKFLNNDKMSLMDFYYPNTRRFEFIVGQHQNGFRLLPYYLNGTDDYAVEAHLNFNTQRLLLKRLPILNKTLISENISLDYMQNPSLDHYFEVCYGLRQIFMLLSVEAVVGFNKGQYDSWGMKVGLSF
ncbi:DUF5686 and carboxypeptidase regulatory-like domain-containing protein [Persicobacter psychrovividus]|uniref:Carboxypeptidase-like regulatory domain-containing protein n=1 Tax=Persicobacter psychrovividus TaxID=387638 RepID=A0ABM7VFR1_9BACT|nr:hypothetical protein PEPS_20900 [Persicobacter psychrovividus]